MGRHMDNYIELIGAAIVVLLILWLGWKLRKVWQSFLFSLRRKRGAKGEIRAVRLLKKAGFSVIDSQISLSGHLYIDGEVENYDVRVDFLVEKKGEKYLAEVKTGESAKVKNRNTRRQLLEYAKLIGSKTVILVDATQRRVMEITFP